MKIFSKIFTSFAFGIFLILCAPSLAEQGAYKNTERLKKLLNYENVVLYTSDFKASSYAQKYATWTPLSELDVVDLEDYSELLISEWEKYPVDWVKKSNLKAIAFVKDLKIEGQARGAMPDYFGEVLYYDVSYLKYGEDYVRECIHHEYFHMISENYYGSVGYQDTQWQALNVASFHYGPGGAAAYDDDSTKVHAEHPQPGFVTGYSTYSLNEDKAEIYAFLMTELGEIKIQKWIKNDAFLTNKISYLKKFILDKSAVMNDSYFEKIAEGRIDLGL